MTKKLSVLMVCLITLSLLAGCQCQHDWVAADCTNPKTCVRCQETVGSPLGHDWSSGSCTEAQTCYVCGRTNGYAMGHDWSEATCTEARTCCNCGQTDGQPLGHTWSSSSCTSAAYCTVCYEDLGAAYGHNWVNTIDLSGVPGQYCTLCGEAEPLPGYWTPLTDCEKYSASNETEHKADIQVDNWITPIGKLPDSLRFCVSGKENYKNNHFIIYCLDGHYDVLSGLIAFHDKSEDYAEAKILIYLDNQLAYESPVLSSTNNQASFLLDVEEVDVVKVLCSTSKKQSAYCVLSAAVS